jgi:hypothetical protein
MSTDNDSYRKKRAVRIASIIPPLREQFKDVNLAPLHAASQKCFNPPKEFGDDYWQEEVLKLNLGTLRNLNNVRPKNTNLNSVSLEFTYQAYGECGEASNDIDPFIHAEQTINIIGRDKDNNKLICAWHFDRHISEEDDNEPLSPHPQYHFQHGGKSIERLDDDENYDFGSSLFLEPPRFFHPPLNLILSLNFLIAQFYSERWKKLKLNNDYRRLVKEEQKKYWTPYFSKLSSYLDTPKQHIEAERLMPILVR